MFRKKPAADSGMADAILQIAERIMREQGIRGTANLDDPLVEDGLGLTSMARLELLSAVERELNVTVPEEYWGTKRIPNLRALAELVSR